jgi:putative endonuclease
MTVLARNVRVGYLEVDLLARDGRTLAVVEVRTRGAGAWTSGFGSVSGLKRTRLRRAAERLWHRRYRFDPTIDHVRIDVASVTFRGEVAEVEYAKGI